jgi:hypothetical protein
VGAAAAAAVGEADDGGLAKASFVDDSNGVGECGVKGEGKCLVGERDVAVVKGEKVD